MFELNIDEILNAIGYEVQRNVVDRLTAKVASNRSKTNPWKLYVYDPKSKKPTYIGCFCNKTHAESAMTTLQNYLDRIATDGNFNVDDCRLEIGYSTKREVKSPNKVYVSKYSRSLENPWRVMIKPNSSDTILKYVGCFPTRNDANIAAEKVRKYLEENNS